MGFTPRVVCQCLFFGHNRRIREKTCRAIKSPARRDHWLDNGAECWLRPMPRREELTSSDGSRILRSLRVHGGQGSWAEDADSG